MLFFCWIPGHVGLAGNEKADFAAKAALNSSQTLVCPLQLFDIRVRAKKCVRVQWQALYDNETKGMHYKAIAPVVGQKPLAQFPSRIKSVTINRLQFGHCLLRMSRFTVGQADDGLCSTCSVPETIHHFFAPMSCFGSAAQLIP